jgi:hypothetical protein
MNLAESPQSAPAAQAMIDGGTTTTTIGPDCIREAPMAAPGRFYFDADYLFWWTRPTKPPPLVIGANLTAPGAVPALNEPGTVVLVGDREIDAGARSGARFRAGFWLDSADTLGLEASGFVLQQARSTFAVVSNEVTTLALPFQDTIPPGGETSIIFASPGTSSGSSVTHTSTSFWGVALDAMCNVAGNSWYRADVLVGVRYLRLAEEISVDTVSTAEPPFGFVLFQGQGFFAPASTLISDSFRTANNFYGGQLGAHVQMQKGNWFADFRAILNAGVTREVLTISGSTTLISPPSPTVTVPGGLLTQISNIGRTPNNEFTIVPEAALSVGYQVTSWLRAELGYSVVYWRQGVLRPDTEISRQVSSTIIPVLNPTPTGAAPLVQLHRADFWGQGVNFGIELTF